MGDAPEVKLRIEAEGERETTAAIKELVAELKNLKKTGDEAGEALGGKLREGFKLLVEAIAVEKLIEFGKEVFQSSLQIAKLSEATGIGTGTLSVYTSAANDFGVKAQQVEGAVVSLGTKTIQLQQGNERAAKSFALIGLSAKDLKNLSAEETLRKVTDAVAALPPGFQKTTAQEKIFSDGSSALTQTLEKLAGDGFNKAEEEAKKFGTFLTDSAGKDLLAAQEQFGKLRAAAEGMARQFEVGLLPAITDVIGALLTATSGDNADGFTKLGETAGKAFKGVSFAIFSIGISAGTAAAQTEETFRFAFDHVGTFAKNLAERVGVFFVHGLKAAQDFAAHQTDPATKEFNARMEAIEKSGRDRQQALYDSLFGDKSLSKTTKPPGPAPPIDNTPAIKAALKLEEEQDKLFAQHLANVRKQIAEEQAIRKAVDDGAVQQTKAQYAQGLLTLEEYFAARRVEILRAAQDERDANAATLVLEQQALARAQGEQAANERKAKSTKNPDLQAAFTSAALRDQTTAAAAQAAIDALKNKQAVDDQKEVNALAADGNDHVEKKIALTKSLRDVDHDQLVLEGKLVEAAKLELDTAEQELRLKLQGKFAADDPEIERRVKALRDQTTANQEFNASKLKGELAFKSLDDARAAIDLQVQSGQTFSLVAEEKIKKLEQDRIPILQAIADSMNQAANVSGLEVDRQAAKDFQLKVDQARVASQVTVGSIGAIKQGTAGIALSSLQNFFSTGITGATSMSAAFQGLADSVISSLQQMISQMLATIIITKLLKAVSGAASGGGGGLGSLPLFNPAGVGGATGGLVTGPGGPTSDTVHARLSPGEFVVKASSVDEVGIATLHAINRGLGAHSIAGLGGVQKFSEGGLVRSEKGDDSKVHLHVSLEEGIVVKHMKSKAGGKVVVTHLADNPKAASKAIGRSS